MKRKYTRELFDRVRAQADKIGLTVCLARIADKNGSIIYGWLEGSIIRINNTSRLSWSKKIHILLHEIGHYLHDEELDRAEQNRINNAYLDIETSPPATVNGHTLRTILSIEATAWDRARRLARELGIPTSKRMFTALEQEGIDYYKSKFEKLK